MCKGEDAVLAKPPTSGGESAVPCGTSTEQWFLREPEKVTDLIISKKQVSAKLVVVDVHIEEHVRTIVM